MLSAAIRTACTELRSRLAPLCDPALDPAAAPDMIASLKACLTPAAIAPFIGDLDVELRPYAVEVHKELRLMQMDVARWSAARQSETQRSRLSEIQTRGDRLLSYLNTLLQADRMQET